MGDPLHADEAGIFNRLLFTVNKFSAETRESIKQTEWYASQAADCAERAAKVALESRDAVASLRKVVRWMCVAVALFATALAFHLTARFLNH